MWPEHRTTMIPSWLPRGKRGRFQKLPEKNSAKVRLIPNTMKGKVVLKRSFLGPLEVVPRELADNGKPVSPLVPLIPGQPSSQYKVIFGTGYETG